MGRSQIDMVRVKLFPGIIRYTIPIILTSLLQLTFNAADMIVVGRFCGRNRLFGWIRQTSAAGKFRLL